MPTILGNAFAGKGGAASIALPGRPFSIDDLRTDWRQTSDPECGNQKRLELPPRVLAWGFAPKSAPGRCTICRRPPSGVIYETLRGEHNSTQKKDAPSSKSTTWSGMPGQGVESHKHVVPPCHSCHEGYMDERWPPNPCSKGFGCPNRSSATNSQTLQDTTWTSACHTVTLAP